MTDTDLKYHLASHTDIDFSAQRGIHVSETVQKDTLDYYIFGGVEATLTYKRFSPFTVLVKAVYQNREYYLINEDTSMRNDDFYRISIGFDYQLKRWLTLCLDYSHSINQSDQDIKDYKENSVFAEVKFSI
jgi:hypothetical protein